MGVPRNRGPRQCASTPRRAEPESRGALLQGRGAGGRAEMAAADRLAGECHFLPRTPRDFHGLLLCLREFSSAREGGRARLSAFLEALERTRARGTRRPLGARDRAALRGSCSRRPRACLQTASGGRKASILSLRPPARLPFFPVLQILGSSSSGNAGRKFAREGGGGWKFLAAPRLCVYGAEEVGGWVEEDRVGESTRSSPSCSEALEITGQLGRKAPLSEEDPQPEPRAPCLTDGAHQRQEGGS